jgi:hypothetical protein
LHEHGRHEHLQLDHARAASQIAQGEVGRATQVLLLVAVGELVGQRRIEVAGHDLKGAGHRLARPDRPGHQLKRFGKLSTEDALASLTQQPQIRQRKGGPRAGAYEAHAPAACQPATKPGQCCGEPAGGPKLLHRHGQARLHEHILKPVPDAPQRRRAVNGQPAEIFEQLSPRDRIRSRLP